MRGPAWSVPIPGWPPAAEGRLYSSATLRHRPVVLFFILAFAITWVVWVPRAFGVGWAVELGAFWTYGPALAAVAAALLHGGREELRRLGRRLTDWRIGVRWYLFVLRFPPSNRP